MDLNSIRSAVTLFGLLLFLGLAAWTWWPTRRNALDQAAMLPFEGEANDRPAPGATDEGRRHE